MTDYLSFEQVLAIHAFQIQRYGGAAGLRDRSGLESAVARPQMTFGGDDLYPDLPTKAAAMVHSLVQNHPFVDGNKRVGAQALLIFLAANDHRLAVSAAELARLILAIAGSGLTAEAVSVWVRQRLVPLGR